MTARPQAHSEYSWTGKPMEQSIPEIKEEILTAIERDALILPTMPEVALRVKEAPRMKTRPRRRSPVLSATTSHYQHASSRSRTARWFVVRRSLRTYRWRSAGWVCNKPETPRWASPWSNSSRQRRTRLTSICENRWEHSTEVASLSYVLCDHFTDLRADQATLAGLVHEIGVLPILAWADDRDWSDEKTRDITSALHPLLGAKILQEWDFPREIQLISEDYTAFNRRCHNTDYFDVVMISIFNTRVGTDHPHAGIPWSDIQAFEHLGIDLDIIFGDQEGMEEEVEAAQDVFA
jgi:hypothetical protein